LDSLQWEKVATEGADSAPQDETHSWLGSKSRVRFRDGQYSLVSFLFAVFLISVTPCPAICKSGRTRAPVLYGVGATNCMYTYETSEEMRMWLFNVIDNMKRVDMLLHRQHFAHVQQRYQLAAECHAVSTTHKRRPLAAITLQLDMALFFKYQIQSNA